MLLSSEDRARPCEGRGHRFDSYRGNMNTSCEHIIRDTNCNECYKRFVLWLNNQRKDSPFQLRAMDEWNQQAAKENGIIIYF